MDQLTVAAILNDQLEQSFIKTFISKALKKLKSWIKDMDIRNVVYTSVS